jgi:recombinational DNA repair protein (RecF pathway)
MSINRNHLNPGPDKSCPHCGKPLAGQLVHIEDLTFLCHRCLREIHAEPRVRRRRLFLLPGRRTRRQPAPG